MNTEGKHLLCEIYGSSTELLNNRIFIEKLLYEVAHKSGATIISGQFHAFEPQGVTGILLLGESHLSIHTWPEQRYAAVDLYTCGNKTQLQKALKYLHEELQATHSDIKEIDRGNNTAPNTIKEKWFYEAEEPQEVHGYLVKDWICRTQSKFQDIAILQNESYGKILFLDGISQSAQRDEYIYHEALVHPAMLAHPNPERILILGGGEGATAREVLRHRSVKQVTMVDIDETLVSICRKHLPEWSHGAFEDPRVELIIEDGYKWMMNSKAIFDVIIMDLTDQIDLGPSFSLYTRKFFEALRTRLASNGVLVVQAGVLAQDETFTHSCLTRTIERAFGSVASYSQYVSSFFSEWSFIISGKNGVLPEVSPATLDDHIAARLDSRLRFYDQATHQKMFTLIPEIKNALLLDGTVVESREQFVGFLDSRVISFQSNIPEVQSEHQQAA